MKHLLKGVALAVLLAPTNVTADLLIETGGEETLGALEALDASSVTFRPVEGPARTVPRDEVARLELHRDRSGTSATNVTELADPILDRALAAVAGTRAYPDAGAVNLYLAHRVTFEADGARRMTVRNIVRVLQERGKGEGTVEDSWLTGVDEYTVDHGRTVMPDGSLRGLTDKGMRVAPKRAGTPEYDRQQVSLMTLPAVDLGRVVDWQTSSLRRRADPHLPPYYRHVIRLGEPVVLGLLEVRRHHTLDYEVLLTRTEGVARTRTREGDYVVDRFEYAGLEPGTREGQMPPSAELFPTVYVAPKASWGLAAAPMRGAVVEAVRSGPLAVALLKKLAVAGKDDVARFRKISNWVAREVRLVGVAMGHYRYAPRDLEDILATRTGSYLDKSVALFGLARAAGLEAELYLDRDRYLPAPPPEIHSLHLFNDALVRVKLAGKWEWRDADDEDLSPETLASSFYDTTVLRIDAPATPDAPGLLPAPALDADLTVTRYETTLEADGTLTGTRDLKVTGNSESTVRGYRNLSKEELKRRMENLNHGFHPSAELLDFRLENVEAFGKPVVYQRRFRVPGYALAAGSKLMAFKMPGLVDSAGDVGLTTRRYPMSYLEREARRLEIRVEIPEGYRVLTLPDSLTIKGQGYAFQATFRDLGKAVTYQGHYQRTAYRVTPEQYPAYKKMRDARAQLAQRWIVVERIR